LIEEALRRSDHLEAVFAAHAEGLTIHAADGEVIRLNPAARELYDVAAGNGRESYRERMAALAPIDASGAPLRFEDLPTRRALRGELVRGFVLALHNTRGRVWVSVSVAPLRGPDGVVVGAVGTSVDITPLRRLEEERERVIRALTHEARSVLQVIRTQGELLGSAPLEEQARRRAESIVSSARKVAGIIDALVGGR
jgi:signal transduction histidine kinase